MVRWPLRTCRVAPGDTATTATTRSVASLALGISMILLPLPLSSSGRSLAGMASMLPALVTATMRSLCGLATTIGCSTAAPGDRLSMALPALLRPVRFSKRVTKP